VLLWLLPLSYVADLTERSWLAVYGLLEISYALSVGFTGIRAHERGIRLYREIWRTM